MADFFNFGQFSPSNIDRFSNSTSTSCFQFMSVNMQNISVVMMNNTVNPSWFLHATAGDLHLDGSTLHSLKTLVVTAALSEARVCTF